MADYDLDKGEIILRRVNRYWADLLSVIVSAIFITLAAIFGEYVYSKFTDVIPFLTPNIVYLVFAIMIIVVILMLLSAVYVYSHNYIVVTNIHLIKVEQSGLFNRASSQLGLGHIEDAKGKREGILGYILNYGDIEIETAGAQENFVFRCAHQPQLLADQLLQYEADYAAGKLPGQTASPTPAAE